MAILGTIVKKFLLIFFDAMLYINSFGTRQLMFRLPLDLVDRSKIEPYCIPYAISYSIYEHSFILNLCINDEDGGGWVEGEGWLDDLLSVRQEILNGDYRALYLAWLAAAQFYQSEDDDIEPPIPPNLKKLSPSLKALISYFELSQDLVIIVSELSPTIERLNSNLEELICRLPEDEKTKFLLDFLRNKPDLKTELQRRLQSFIGSEGKEEFSPKRTVSQLRDLEEQAIQLREQKQAEEQKVSRIKALKLLENKAPALWQEVNSSIQLKTQKGYDHAAQLLCDLKELAGYLDKKELFESRIKKIHQDYRSLSSFIRRLYQYELM